ncbi:MAG TPA: AAA family ATPase [Candidatus Limnocylindrales bacterium]|nr:AAA family ATPase [Candidatus Limnocylindrales bacterium]
MEYTLIGIAGTNGSGKDTVGHYLAYKHNYLFISVTDLLRAELNRQGLPVDREHLRELSANWRREFGYGVLIDRAYQAFEPVASKYTGLAIASLRNPFEADRVHELGGAVWWLDADPRIRYDRIQANAALRHRAEEDNKTYEEFLAEEAAEMHKSGDAATLDMASVKDRANLMLVNGGSELRLLEQEIDTLLAGPASE